MLGINGWEFLLLAVIGLLILGPEKLPGFIADAGRTIRQIRRMATDARADVVRELGPEFQDINLSDLNPKTFITKHLLDDDLDLDLDTAVNLDSDDPPAKHAKRTDAPSPATPARPATQKKSLDGMAGRADRAADGPRGDGVPPAGADTPPATRSTGRHAAPEAPPPPPYDPDAT